MKRVTLLAVVATFSKANSASNIERQNRQKKTTSYVYVILDRMYDINEKKT